MMESVLYGYDDVLKLNSRVYFIGQKARRDPKMNVDNEISRWVHCPVCGAKTRTKVYRDTVMLRFPLYCRQCGQETKIDVLQFEMKKSAEPDT